MKTYLKFAAVLAFGTTVQSLSAAEVSGKISLKGKPPEEKEITPIKNDANCGKTHDKPVFTRHYLVSADGGLANVFVYIKTGLEGKKFEAPKTPTVVDQIGCLYEPYVTGAVVGQEVHFKNSDTFMHNVNGSFSTVGNPVFNIAQTRQGQVDKKTLTKPEVFFKVACNVHPWMFGYIGVVEHPYFAVSDKDGNFKLPADLPAGKYTLAAKHLKANGAAELTQEITVPEGGLKDLKLTLEVK